jgi:hypothetical protein
MAKEVKRVTSVKRSHSQTDGLVPGLALRPGAAPRWRLLSSLMLALLAAILLVRPSAAIAQTGGAKTQAKPVLNVVVIGDFYSYGYAYSADPALRGSVPPTLQALNQIQAANPGIQVNVLFIPVKDATRNWLPPVVNSVRDANIVIVGVGANDARFTDSMRTILFGTAASAKAFPQLMAVFDNGSFLQAQAAFLSEIAARAAPGASIVTLGYPTVLPEQLPSGFTWWSPFRWTSISQQQANMSNQLVSALNTANDQATSIAAAHHSGLHFLYADLSGALQGKGPFGPQPGRQDATAASTRGSQSDLRQTLIGSDLLPYVDQAVNDVLSTKGLQGAQDIPSITPKSRWNLTVHEPVEVQVQPAHPKSNLGVNTQPQINWNDPTSQPPPPSNLPANPTDTGGPTAGGQQASGQAKPSISIPSADVGQTPSADTGRRDNDQPSGTPQPVDTGQPSSAAQPSGAGQPSGAAQPSGTGLPTSAAQPSGTSLPSEAAPGGCTVSASVACPGQDCGVVCSHAGSGGGPASVPVIPAPPAPLPPPITPHEIPGAGTAPGSGATPVTPATSTTPVTPATGTALVTPATGTALVAPATGTAPATPATGTAPATGTPPATPTTGTAPATAAAGSTPQAPGAAPATTTTPATGTPPATPATGPAPATPDTGTTQTTGTAPATVATGTALATPAAGTPQAAFAAPATVATGAAPATAAAGTPQAAFAAPATAATGAAPATAAADSVPATAAAPATPPATDAGITPNSAAGGA